MNEPISIKKLRELDLESPSQSGRPSHVSAASGLVRLQDALYVIPDDELQLAMFTLNDDAPGRLLALGSRKLPLDPKQRKRSKPDFETLVHIPPSRTRELGGLLVLGSGSTPQRVFAHWIALDTRRQPSDVMTFKLEHLYAAAAHAVGEVNIEGAVVIEDELLLFQRGNKGSGINAVLGFDLQVVLDAMHAESPSITPHPHFVREYQLGTIGGVPLSFTDAAALPNGWVVFTAVAEDTTDAYADGACAGAAIGLIDADGKLARICAVAEAVKIEGVDAELRDSMIQLLLVTDADDPRIPAALLQAELALPDALRSRAAIPNSTRDT